MMLRIGIYSSTMRMGKSSIAIRLTRRHGFSLLKHSRVLKNMLRGVFLELGYSSHSVEEMIEGRFKHDPIPEMGDKTPVELMQSLGAEWGRDMVHPNLWVGLTAKRMARHEGRTVLDDVRFPNEYESLMAQDVVMLRVIRPGTKAINDHPSEGLLDHNHFDHVLMNDGTLRDLNVKVDNLIFELEKVYAGK